MKFYSIVFFLLSLVFGVTVSAQSSEKPDGVSAATTVAKQPSRLQLGGYGEITYSRNFYSNNVFRYQNPERYKDDPSHGIFDMPHVVFFVGYELGNGWRMNAEIEFEHGGVETAMELEPEEGGEFEAEVERGGEVVLEQFWIEKTFNKAVNLRLGHIIVPVGLTNGNHLPTQFFTVFRPQGERTILPCTWHETGVSLWGDIGDWHYDVQLLPGLDADFFSSDKWVSGGSPSPYEFKTANKYAGALRIDNRSVPGLRLGISGYYGYSFNNGGKMTTSERYKGIKGAVAIGSFDFDYKGYNWIVRGYFDYGHLGDAAELSRYHSSLAIAPFQYNIASDAMALGIEAGYDIFSFIPKLRNEDKKLYVFGRYEDFDSMYKVPESMTAKEWCGRQIFSGGVNYFPTDEIVIKAEYSCGILPGKFNNENAINIGVAYAGFFTK